MTRPTVSCRLSMPHMERFYDYVLVNHRGATTMCEPGAGRGQRVAICGAGPSLREAVIPRGCQQVWACNSALPYLVAHGVAVTHGITVDQGEAMVGPQEWGSAPPVEYLLASSVHPSLVAHLRAAGRAVRFFHNFLGLPAPDDWIERPGFGSYEDWLYRKLYPTSICAGLGLNTVPRAVCLALGMGFDRIDVLGADCACAPGTPPIDGQPGEARYTAWLDRAVLYADGRTARCYGDADPMVQTDLGGRLWQTRPDMVISAMHLLQLEREAVPGRIVFHGETLVHALREADPARLPVLDNGTIRNFATPPCEAAQLAEVL